MNNSPSSKSRGKQNYSVSDIMNTLKTICFDVKSINTKLLTQENTLTAILTQVDILTKEIIA